VASEDVIKVFTEALAHELERLEVQTAQSS
jgi:hypothetical protein